MLRPSEGNLKTNTIVPPKEVVPPHILLANVAKESARRLAKYHYATRVDPQIRMEKLEEDDPQLVQEALEEARKLDTRERERIKIFDKLIERFWNNSHLASLPPSPPFFGALKENCFLTGIAKMLTLGDWSVNREEEVSEGMGIQPLEDIETILLQFYQRYGLISENPGAQPKLVHFHAGCGNGVLMERLRRSRKQPFNNGHSLNEYFEEIGYADRIYFSLNEFLAKFVRKEHKSETFDEFLKIIVTLLLRKIEYFNENENPEGKKIRELRRNMNVLRDILPNLTALLDLYALLDKGTYLSDEEFLKEKEQDISNECIELISEYIKNPEDFLERYFDERFYTKNKAGKHMVHLNSQIDIYPQNIILGDFKDIGKLPPNSINMFHSYRASSHLDAERYLQFILDIASLLPPGGIGFDEGVRASYSRYYRLEEILKVEAILKEKLGPEFNVRLIVDEEGKLKCLYLERGLRTYEGSLVFLSDIYGDKIFNGENRYKTLEEYAKGLSMTSHTINYIRGYYAKAAARSLRENYPPLVVARKMKDHQFLFYCLQEAFKDRSIREAAADLIFDNPEHLAEPILESMKMLRDQVHECMERAPTDAERKLINKDIWNWDVPTFGDYEFEQERAVLIDMLTVLKAKLGPVRLIEFSNNSNYPRGGCFTSYLMRDTLIKILGKDNFDSFVQCEHINLSEPPSAYPDLTKGAFIIGGSTNDTYDTEGSQFREHFVIPLVKMISDKQPVTAFGVCFGHQILAEAYAEVLQITPGNKTNKGILQCGYYPVKFDGNAAVLGSLKNKRCAAVVTRSGYFPTTKLEVLAGDILGIEILASQPGINIETGEPFPAMALSLAHGRIITSQFHPEARATEPAHALVIEAFWQRTVNGICQSTYETYTNLYEKLLDESKRASFNGYHFPRISSEILTGSNLSGMVAKDFGPYFMVRALKEQVSYLLTKC